MPRPSCARALLALAGALAVAGCAERPRVTELRDAFAGFVAPLPAPSADRPGSGTGRGQARATEPSTFVDGQLAGVLRFRELPDRLAVRWKVADDGRKLRRYGLADYLEALGLDLARVRAVHLYGARDRVSILPGDELREHRDDMLFSFTQGEGGKPRAHYPPVSRMPVNTFVDAIQDIAVYVTREPPSYDAATHAVRLADGGLVHGIPYGAAERPHGTRVYVDGALSLWTKRRALPEPDADGQRSLAALFAAAGVDLDAAESLVLVTGDDVAREMGREALAAEAASLRFTMPPKSRGHLSMVFGGGEPEPVAALLVRTRPPQHGSRVNHPLGESATKNAPERLARAVLKSPPRH